MNRAASLHVSVWPALDWKIVAGLGVAALTAWFAPFDRAFDAVTLGVPALRAAMIVALAVIGAWAGKRSGLRIATHGLRRPVLTPLAIASAVAVACVAADWTMRAALHPGYLAVVTGEPLGLRLVAYMLRAFNENIIYRLFLGSLLTWLIGLGWKDAAGRPTPEAVWVAFLLSQGINIWINATSLAPLTPLALAHDAVRYVAPGMVWGWLYWRHGFQSTEIASTGVHLVFQPLVALSLGASAQ